MKQDLSKFSLNDLMREIEKRKEEAIPECVRRINKEIQTLKNLGINILDVNDCEYRLKEVRICKSGTVEYNYIERWDD